MDPNIFLFVFNKKINLNYLCEYLPKEIYKPKNINPNIFIFIFGSDNPICHTLNNETQPSTLSTNCLKHQISALSWIFIEVCSKAKYNLKCDGHHCIYCNISIFGTLLKCNWRSWGMELHYAGPGAGCLPQIRMRISPFVKITSLSICL